MEALQKLDTDPDLAVLHERLTAFNFFEAVGMYGQEIRHSRFLAFLLSPQQSHGLGDVFLRWFVCEITARTKGSPSRETVKSWDLSDAQVDREWKDIDILVRSPRSNLTIVIENKVWSGEHSNQLARYKEIADAHRHPDGILLGVYLTPRGGKSSHDWYTPVGYEAICTFLESLCEGNAIGAPEARLAVYHYTRLLRRHIVGEPETTCFCRDLYNKHRTAFDRIYAEIHSNDRQEIARGVLEDLIKNEKEITFLCSLFWPRRNGIHYVLFSPQQWATEPGLWEGYDGKNDENFKQIFVLQFNNARDGSVEIVCQVRPGPAETRRRLTELAYAQNWLPKENINPASGYTNIYKRSLLTPLDYLEGEEKVREIVQTKWVEFMETDFLHFAALIQPGDFPAVENA